jgi:hypothetical protein
MMIEIDVMEFRVGGGDDSFAKPKKKNRALQPR